MVSTPSGALQDPVRLAAVRESGLLGAAAASSWDALTDLAAQLLDAPMAFMTVADDQHSYWLSCSGVVLSSDADRENPVEDSFCQYVIADRAAFVVDDAAAHPRTRDSRSVSLLGVRAWAGYPVLDSAGNSARVVLRHGHRPQDLDARADRRARDPGLGRVRAGPAPRRRWMRSDAPTSAYSAWRPSLWIWWAPARWKT